QPGAGQVQTISDSIADQNGSGGSAVSNGNGANGGVWNLAVSGGGKLVLSGTNTYSGDTNLSGAGTTIAVGNNSALGTSTLAMAAGTTLWFLNTGNFHITNNITVAGDPTFPTPVGST